MVPDGAVMNDTRWCGVRGERFGRFGEVLCYARLCVVVHGGSGEFGKWC